MDRSKILKLLKHYKQKKGKDYGIKRIGIFGSYAKGIGGSESDIDVVIELEKPDLF